MMRKEVEQKAFDYFQSGFQCAEAISKTLTELFADDVGGDIPRVASGFGGGIGGSHEDVCGALTGGVIAIGRLLGRMETGPLLKDTYRTASNFRKQFVEKFGSTNCQVILTEFGPQDNMDKCKRLTAEAAGLLADLLFEMGLEPECQSCSTGTKKAAV
jgi:C_GCAxxG_C_C family probable redox protein